MNASRLPWSRKSSSSRQRATDLGTSYRGPSRGERTLCISRRMRPRPSLTPSPKTVAILRIGTEFGMISASTKDAVRKTLGSQRGWDGDNQDLQIKQMPGIRSKDDEVCGHVVVQKPSTNDFPVPAEYALTSTSLRTSILQPRYRDGTDG